MLGHISVFCIEGIMTFTIAPLNAYYLHITIFDSKLFKIFIQFDRVYKLQPIHIEIKSCFWTKVIRENSNCKIVLLYRWKKCDEH